MKQKIEFRNPSMKQYEKQSGGMLPMLIVIVVLALVGRYIFASEALPLPHVELTRFLATGGQEMLRLDCQPEANPAHYFCRLEKLRDTDVVAQVVIDQKKAAYTLNEFFKRWPANAATRSTASGRASLSWTISDGTQSITGESVWRDQAMESQTSAVLSLEGALRAQLTH